MHFLQMEFHFTKGTVNLTAVVRTINQHSVVVAAAIVAVVAVVTRRPFSVIIGSGVARHSVGRRLPTGTPQFASGFATEIVFHHRVWVAATATGVAVGGVAIVFGRSRRRHGRSLTPSTVFLRDWTVQEMGIAVHGQAEFRRVGQCL